MSLFERLAELRKRNSQLRLFALVDGLTFALLHEKPLSTGPHRRALFDGTPDAPLAPSGPWLIDAELDRTLVDELQAKEAEAPHVSWLLSDVTLSGLTQLLQLRLDAKLPDGSIALLRFYDPRVLKGLAMTLTAEQRTSFFEHITEWHFMCDEQPFRIGRADA